MSGMRYRSGVAGERHVRAVLEGRGYYVVRSAGSKGAIDLVGVKGDDVRYVQVKTCIEPKGERALTKLADDAGRKVHEAGLDVSKSELWVLNGETWVVCDLGTWLEGRYNFVGMNNEDFSVGARFRALNRAGTRAKAETRGLRDAKVARATRQMSEERKVLAEIDEWNKSGGGVEIRVLVRPVSSSSSAGYTQGELIPEIVSEPTDRSNLAA